MTTRKKSLWRMFYRQARKVSPPTDTSEQSKSQIIGFVETLRPASLHGWVISYAPERRPDVVLEIDGSEFVLQTQPVRREDVARSHGQEHLHSGFSCQLSAEITVLLREALEAELPIRVRCGDTRLPIISVSRDPDPEIAKNSGSAVEALAVPATAESMSSSLATHCSSDRISLDSWREFTIRGRTTGPSPTLQCNGSVVDSSLCRFDPEDSSSGAAVFELELPGFLWNATDGATDASLQLVADGIEMLATPLTLTRTRAVSWITAIARLPEDTEHQYQKLLALEHIRFGGFWSLLDEDSRRLYSLFVKKMRLEDYIEGSLPELVPEPAQSTDPTKNSDAFLWRVTRDLNRRLGGGSGSLLQRVRSVLEAKSLSANQRRRFLLNIVPELCRRGELEELRSMLEFAPVYSREISDTNWELSVVCALLAADGLYDRATATFWRIAEKKRPDWLNSECILYALRKARLAERAGDLGAKDAELLRYGFLGILESFGGEWNSRLHDACLIDAMTSVLAESDGFTEWLRADTISAAIRHYGLCPTFWAAIGDQVPAETLAGLVKARSAFDRVCSAIESSELSSESRIRLSREALGYFMVRKNPDALQCLRELVAKDLVENAGQPSSPCLELIEELQSFESADSIRIGAFPALDESVLVKSDGAHLRIFQGIQRLSDRPRSPVYSIQLAAFDAWSAARSGAITGDTRKSSAARELLWEYAIRLANAESGFLGADLCASGWMLEQPDADHGGRWICQITETALLALANDELPAPVCTGLATLASAPLDPTGATMLADLQKKVRARFGRQYDEIFLAPAERSDGITENGWISDTLVIVYSCRKYLDSRVRAVRDTWLKDLDARGIPWLIAVGDGEDAIEENRVLGLRVSDAYEDLPQKTLALFRWINERTHAQYVIKIDDDCYLDVERYFGTLSYRKHHYYGRIIRRAPGSTDRLWHQAKSRSAHARLAMDKSPEPSIYADGGGGYALSRTAIRALLRMADTVRGRRLSGVSFMEDKLVGDLLAMARINPSAEDYESCQRRRTFGEAEPVAMWENTFFPSRITPTKVIHLDTERDQSLARQISNTATLWPKKLWPSHQRVDIGGVSSQLELLTPPGKALALARHSPRVVAVIRNERLMLPHFLEHYRSQGVRSFIFVDNCSDDGSREYLLREQEDVVLFSADAQYKDTGFGVAWQQTVLSNLCCHDWTLLADADEFLVYPGCETRSLAEFVAEIEREGADTVETYMVDMYPDGPLAAADFRTQRPFEAAGWFDRQPLLEWRLGSGPYGNAPIQYLSGLRHRLAPEAEPYAFTCQKKALVRYRPWMRFSVGAHNQANGRLSLRSAAFAHFKYHAGFEAKVNEEILRKQHFNDADEYHRYARMLPALQTGLAKPGISTRYEGSHSFGKAGLFERRNANSRATTF